MNCKAVIDTNVIVSYLLSKRKKITAVIEVMNKIFDREIDQVTSREIFEEYEDVLRRPEFGFDEDVVNKLLDFFRQNSIVTETWDTGAELPDPDDLPFFEAYIAEQNPETFLVTGNQRHYPKWPYIVTPRQMMDYLEG